MGKKLMSAYVTDEDILYLKQNGINQSKFVRDAIKAHKADKWKYNHLEE